MTQAMTPKRILADTHIFLWWLSDDPQLSAPSREQLADPLNRVYISAVSIWEIALKVQRKKLAFAGDPISEIATNGFIELPLTALHAAEAGQLPGRRFHKDPFDRFLVAQARLEELELMTADQKIWQSYGHLVRLLTP